ncbi:MAG: EF2563 family selenium-dependent molybdenum hydroxylase system protein [Deltaproteobacteria bacterium]|nr:EF2563 family selenium-dependent molybdenum hydroxylase system protein [Deltaproteobacteria bacterium]
MNNMIVCIKGAGEMATAVAWRLYMANIREIIMLESPRPLAVRRKVSFCEAVFDGTQTVENVSADFCHDVEGVHGIWQESKIAVTVDPTWHMLKQIKAGVVVDAILAKKNLGTTISDARLVVGLGPGFIAGQDVHMVVETNRGHNLGRIIESGSAEPNTGIPGSIGGYSEERVLRAPADGLFCTTRRIGDKVKKGDVLGTVQNRKISANVGGVVRGLLRSNSQVHLGLKIGDIDPRGEENYCHMISDKARAIAGSVLEAVLREFPPVG